MTAPAEIIVVADGCTDRTVEAIHALGDERIVVLDLPKGPGYGWIHRNGAFRIARGEIIVLLADDDLWLPDHLQRTVELTEAGVAELVQANACRVHADGRLELSGTDWRVAEYRRRYFEEEENRVPMSAITHLRDAAVAVGGWRTVERHGDWDLWTRMMEAGVPTAATMEPTVLVLEAWRADTPDRERNREQEARELLSRLGDPLELARLRAEISGADLRFEAETPHALYECNDQHAALHERYATDIATLRAELHKRNEQHAALHEDYAGALAELAGRRE